MSMLSRTDDQRMIGAPFSVSLGGAERALKPLPRRKAREWQTLLVEKLLGLAAVPLTINTASFSAEGVKGFADAFMLRAPDAVAEVVFTYLRLCDESVSKEWFEENASDEEIADSFLRMVEVAYPFYLRKDIRNAGLSFGKWLMSELGVSLKLPNTNGAPGGTSSKTGATSGSG